VEKYQADYLHSLLPNPGKHCPQLGQNQLAGIKTFHWFSHISSATPVSPVSVFDGCWRCFHFIWMI